MRWALMEAAQTACRHPLYRERYQRNKRRLGKQRGTKVAQVDIARRLAEAIWHMLTRNQPFAPAGASCALAAKTALV
jgi:transposase